jgi:hypothetical protein
MFPPSYFPSSLFSFSYFPGSDAEGGGSGGGGSGGGVRPDWCPEPADDHYLYPFGRAFTSTTTAAGLDIYRPFGPGQGSQAIEDATGAQDPGAFVLSFPTAYLLEPIGDGEYTTSDTTDGDPANNRLPGWDYEHATPSDVDRYWIAVDRYGAYVTANEWAHGVGFHDPQHVPTDASGAVAAHPTPYANPLAGGGSPNGHVVILSGVEAKFARLLLVGGDEPAISIHPDRPQNFANLLRMARTRANAMFRWRKVAFDLTYSGVVNLAAQDPRQVGIRTERFPFDDYDEYRAISGYIDTIEITHDADSDGQSLPATRIRSYPANNYPVKVMGYAEAGACVVPPVPHFVVARTKPDGIRPAIETGTAIAPRTGLVNLIGPDGRPGAEDTTVENWLGPIQGGATVILGTNPCNVPMVIGEACLANWDNSSSSSGGE